VWNFGAEISHHHYPNDKKFSAQEQSFRLELAWDAKKTASTSFQYQLEIVDRGLIGAVERPELGETFAALSKGGATYSMGLQRVSWGETFGISVLDVVNPVDYSNPLASSAKETQLPSPILSLVYQADPFTLQGIVAPCVRDSVAPSADSRFSPLAQITSVQLNVQNERGQFATCEPRNSEGGGRLSWLGDSGLDLSAIYYTHQNRNLVYDFWKKQERNTASVINAEPAREKVYSLGASSSYAFESSVLRFEGAFTVGQPLWFSTQYGLIFGDILRTIAAYDFVTEQQYNFGLQHHMDSVIGGENKHWASLFGRLDFWEKSLEMESFGIFGLNNDDKRIKGTIKWNANHIFSLGASYDWIDGVFKPGGTASPFGLMKDKDRLSLTLAAKH
jgi:hypothetical protein